MLLTVSETSKVGKPAKISSNNGWLGTVIEEIQLSISTSLPAPSKLTLLILKNV